MEAKNRIRHEFRTAPQADPTDPEYQKRIRYAQDVAAILKSNVVQGVPQEDNKVFSELDPRPLTIVDVLSGSTSNKPTTPQNSGYTRIPSVATMKASSWRAWVEDAAAVAESEFCYCSLTTPGGYDV